MGYLIILLLLLNTALFYSKIFDKKIEQTIFLTIFSYILILFLFGIFDFLNAGFWTIIICNIFTLVYNIYSCLNKKVTIKKNILTIGLFFFVVSYFLIVWQSLGRLASSWDEFSHWALAVKNMYGLGNLGLGSDSTLMVKDYLSGTSLFQFFCVKVFGEFKESVMYVGMDIMIISLIIPIFSGFDKKKSFLGCILYFVLFFIPAFFYPTIYYSLYVDAILGLTFAYCLYSYFGNRSKKLEKFDIINLIASYMMLIFIKDFGLVLLLISFAIILIDNIFIRNKFSFKTLIKNNYLLLISALPAFILKFIWSITLSLHKVGSDGSNSQVLATVKNLITFNLIDYQIEVAKSFTNATFCNSLSQTFIPITYVFAAFICIIISYFTIRNVKKQDKKSIILLITLVILGAVAYAGLLYLAYISIFGEYESTRLASFNRYMSTYALASIFISIAIYIKKTNDDNKLGNFTMILLFLFLINFSFPIFLNMTIFARGNSYSSVEMRSNYNEFATKANKYVNKKDCLYFVSTNDNGIDYYIAKYELTPYKMNKKFGWSIGIPYSEEDIWTIYKSPDDWRNELLSDYTYVYLFDIDDPFIELYGSLFNDSNIKDNQLYKVVKSDSYSILEFVE